MEKTNVLFAFAIAVILGLIFLTTLSQPIADQSSTSTVTDDQYTASNTSCVKVTSGNDCIISLTSVENVSAQAIGSANYSLCVASNGGSLLSNGIINNGDATTDGWYNGQTLNATYTMSQGCVYNPNATSRNLTSLLPLFFAIFLVIMAIYYFKEGGLPGIGEK